MNEVLVLAEHRRGKLREVTFEMLTLAGQLAEDNDLSVSILLLGDQPANLMESLKGCSDRILLMQDAQLAQYNADTYLPAMETAIRSRRPFLTMIGHTAAGMDLAPALAARLGLPLATDCLEVKSAQEQVAVLRHLYGGKIHDRLTLKPSDGYLVSIRPGCCAAEVEGGKATEVEISPPPAWKGRRGRRFLEYIDAEIEDVDIAAAQILVSVGRGLGKQENMPAVEDFANAIGATLSCSRPVADKGWLPKSRQVGTSGKAVRPKVYIALGISGAYQHVAGMRGADTIIAVNKDSAAPIFEVAHYGIVADMFEVIPKLKERFAAK